MNRVIAILLLSIQLYTAGGYVALRQYMVHRSNAFFNAQAAKNQYYKADLFEIRVPVNFNDVQDWRDYEHISGQIRFKNNVYNYVQMRITRHTMYLRCIPNYQATRHINQNILIAGPIRDIPAPKKDHIPDAGVLLIAGLPVTLQPIIIQAAVLEYNPAAIHTYHQPIVNRAIETLKQPPEFQA